MIWRFVDQTKQLVFLQFIWYWILNKLFWLLFNIRLIFIIQSIVYLWVHLRVIYYQVLLYWGSAFGGLTPSLTDTSRLWSTSAKDTQYLNVRQLILTLRDGLRFGTFSQLMAKSSFECLSLSDRFHYNWNYWRILYGSRQRP